MADVNALNAYLAGLEAVLPPPTGVVSMRDREAARPLSPYESGQLEQLQQFLQQSQALQEELWQRWQQAQTARERSLAEVQMLGAAAADLAIAERLAYSAGEVEAPQRMRSALNAGQEQLIRQALESPESLIEPAPLPQARRGGGEKDQLLEATWKCLEAVRKDTARASKDAISSLLAMRLAVVKEAVEMLGADLGRALDETSSGFLKSAVDYVVSAVLKLRLLIGPDGEQEVKQAVLDFLEKVKDEEFINKAVDKFLDTRDVYDESKTWIRAYEGDAAELQRISEEIAALQGSFDGRVKVVNAVVKGLAVVKLLPILATPPWGPLGVAAAYLGVVGYTLYSAHDHVDSGKYAFFDRVRGVRGTLKAELVGQEPAS